MSTATMNHTDARAKIDELLEKADALRDEYNQGMAEVTEGLEEALAAFRSPLESGNGSATAVPKPQAQRRPNTPKNSKPAPKNAAKKNAAKTGSDKRNYSNTMSLPEAIFDVLDRSHAQHKKLLPDLPKEADGQGLKINEIKDIIEKEGKWVSSSDDIAPQLHIQLAALRKKELVARGDNHRYYVVQGAKYEKPQRGRKNAN